MPAVLFVCTANICRSPMAAKIFQLVEEKVDDLAKWKVESAGTWAVNGQRASENAQIVLETMGMDLSKHQSRNVADIDLVKFDLILTMEKNHKEALASEFPEITDRLYMLSEMLGSSFDIADPIGGTIEDYKNTAEFLEDLITIAYPRIKALSIESKDRN